MKRGTREAWTPEKERVVRAAVALCKAGKGFCFRDDLMISDKRIGRRLEYACAALARRRKS
jgi:hypothetical protein